MTQLPSEDDSPFSFPHDVPEIMPIDHPDLDSGIDIQEAYDEGLDDIVDGDPYRLDGDPIKSAKRLMQTGMGVREYYTLDHDRIRRWSEARYGHPARIVGANDDLGRGGLYISFEDDEPEIDTEPISWREFFSIFEKNRLAFLYRTKLPNGAQSKFYALMDRGDITRVTEARRTS